MNDPIAVLTVPDIQRTFAYHNLTPIIGDWFGFSEPDGSVGPLRAADITGILLVRSVGVEDALHVYREGEDLEASVRLCCAADAVQTDMSVLYWLGEGWDWKTCGSQDQYEYPDQCRTDRDRYAYRLGLSASKQIFGDDPEVRRAYRIGMPHS